MQWSSNNGQCCRMWRESKVGWADDGILYYSYDLTHMAVSFDSEAVVDISSVFLDLVVDIVENI